MSSKLVKKQLSALVHTELKENPALSKNSKSKEKRRQKQKATKLKQLQKEAHIASTAKNLQRRNLAYYQTTKGPSEQNAQLMAQLLTAATKKNPRAARLTVCRSAAPSGAGGAAGSAFGDPNTLVGMLMAYAVQLQQQEGAGASNGAVIRVENLSFHPPGSENPLLDDVSMRLPANSLGLVIGRSGSGKTTLLQVLAGLTEQTSGHVRILKGAQAAATVAANGNGSPAAQLPGSNGNGNGAGPYPAGAGGPLPPAPSLTMDERMQQVGLVFQFPERHFLGESLMQELTFTWPRLPQYWGDRQLMSNKMQQVLQAVGLEDIPLEVPPWALSGGQQRRLALAIQLVRQPALLLLDEPLAGLDWTSRQEVVTILRKLKEQCTLLVVSHDLAEMAPLVDCAWRMLPGGRCEPVTWPPTDLEGLEQ